MTVTIIAAVARNGVIGADGDIPWTLPGEQARFKQTTMGHVLVMGRATYESIGRPLPGRTTVVVTRQERWQPEGGLPDGLLVAGSVEAALVWAGEIDEQVFVAGGAQVYAESLPATDVLLMTWVDAEPAGDTFFPAVDWDEWREVSREDHDGWTLAAYERLTADGVGGQTPRDMHPDQA
jgi:dihydrofolate reductase